MAKINRKEQVTVGLVQMSTSEVPEANVAKAVERIELAARKGAQIVCLQELFRSQYFCQTEDHGCFALAEPVPGPSTEQLGKLADGRRLAGPVDADD